MSNPADPRAMVRVPCLTTCATVSVQVQAMKDWYHKDYKTYRSFDSNLNGDLNLPHVGLLSVFDDAELNRKIQLR